MDYLLLFFSLILWIISIFFSCKNRAFFYTILGIFFVLCVFSGFFVASDQITGVGINQAVIYHLFAPAQWADFVWNIVKILTFIGFIVLWICAVYLSLTYLKKQIWKWHKIWASLLIIASILSHPWIQDVYNLTYGYYKVQTQLASKMDENFVP